MALNDYARTNDPFAKIGEIQIAVEVSSVIRASNDSFQVRWIERRYEDGALTATDRWSAFLTVIVSPPSDADHLRKNPLGVYVTAKQTAAAEATAPVASGIDIAALNFRYSIEGDKPPWRPIRAFDDGRQVIISFPPGIGQGEMPPLFVVGPSGKTSDLVNYRVRGDQMIVDRLFAAAELRLGDKVSQSLVRIVRTDGAPW